MFDVGFWELCLLGLISLLVIGPERLPKVARISGFWLGKTRTIVASVKQEIKEELREEEIRQALREQAGVDEFKQILDNTSQTAKDVQASLEQIPDEIKSQKKHSGDDAG